MKNRVLLFSVSLVVAASLAVALVSWRASLKFYMLEKLSHFSPRDAMCLCELGKLHYKGKGTPRSIKRSLECFQKAAALNNPKAYYKLGNILSHRFQIERGLEANPSFWDGVQFNLREALRCYRISASMGYPGACVRLGFFSIIGLGTDRSYRDAFYWYSKAALQGNAIGQWWLGHLYSHALGLESKENLPNQWDEIPLDYKKAIEWFTLAANQGFAQAQCWLGYLYSHGGGFMDRPPQNEWSSTGIERDLDVAIEWYTKAAEQGNEIAQYHLGYLYLRSGDDHDGHFKQAHMWLVKAASKGNRFAQRLLGSMYEFGAGVPLNHKEALEWYAKAAEQGDHYAAKYRTEILSKKDRQTSHKLLAHCSLHDSLSKHTILT